MFDGIRQSFLLKALREAVKNNHRSRKTYGLNNASEIGILFDATDLKKSQEIIAFAEALEKKGKKVNLLGFNNSKEPAKSTGFHSFNRKELNWKGIPVSDTCDKFLGTVFQLLICYNPEENPIMHWLAVNSKAQMKTGFATSMPNDFDLQLDLPGGKSIQYFAEQLEQYLDKIAVNSYESAAAL